MSFKIISLVGARPNFKKIAPFTFFTRKQLLAVDQQMIKNNMIHFSRDAGEIADKVKKLNKQQPDFSRSKEVRKEVQGKLKEVIGKFDK